MTYLFADCYERVGEFNECVFIIFFEQIKYQPFSGFITKSWHGAEIRYEFFYWFGVLHNQIFYETVNSSTRCSKFLKDTLFSSKNRDAVPVGPLRCFFIRISAMCGRFVSFL